MALNTLSPRIALEGFHWARGEDKGSSLVVTLWQLLRDLFCGKEHNVPKQNA